MGKRYENTDASGKRAFQQDGMEVYEQTDGSFRVCFDPSRLRDDTAWAPSSYATVDDAFKAGAVAKEMVAQQAAG